MSYNVFYLLGWLAFAAGSKEYDPYYDVNGDGVISLADLLELLSLFGTTT